MPLFILSSRLFVNMLSIRVAVEEVMRGNWFGDQRIEAVRCHKINELIFRLMRMRLEDVDIKITHNILDSLFSRLMADKISSICLSH